MDVKKLEERLTALRIGVAGKKSQLADLDAATRQTIADMRVTEGAVKECEYWLEQLSDKESK